MGSTLIDRLADRGGLRGLQPGVSINGVGAGRLEIERVEDLPPVVRRVVNSRPRSISAGTMEVKNHE